MQPSHTKQIDLFQNMRTAFDAKDVHGYFYDERAQALLWKLIPPSLLFSSSESAMHFFLSSFPIIKWIEWGEREVSVLLLAKQRTDAMPFFCEMITEGCLPGKRFSPAACFSMNIELPALSNQSILLAEILLCSSSREERFAMKQAFSRIEGAIKLGLSSAYHAKRILETKGLTAEQKAWWVQERIRKLLQRRQVGAEFDIFSDMQYFLITASSKFKEVRTVALLARIICLFALFREELKKLPHGMREVRVKVFKTAIRGILGTKQVLSLIIGMRFANDTEVFEREHLLRAAQTCLPHFQMVEGSFFSRVFKEERICLLYMEGEIAAEKAMEMADVISMREKLPDAVKYAVEQWMRPMFMPRNEEEVMRNIILLSRELNQTKDLPQVSISFEGQTESHLTFVVILLQLRTPSSLSIAELFKRRPDSSINWVLEDRRTVGMLRRRYEKEAIILRVSLPAISFLQFDHKINIVRARQEVLRQLQEWAGEVRDFNGGMIAKQQDQFLACRALFPTLDGQQEMLLEMLFHSLLPIERRSAMDPLLMKEAFLLLNALIRRGEFLQAKQMEGILIVFISDRDAQKKALFMQKVHAFHGSSSELSTFFFASSAKRPKSPDKIDGST